MNAKRIQQLLWGLSFCLAVTVSTGFATEPAALDDVNLRALMDTDPNLTGRGVLLGAVCRSQTYINDKPLYNYRFNVDHDCLYDADVVFLDSGNGTGTSSHATAIAGILLGLDENGFAPEAGSFQYRGICPDTSVDAYEFEYFSTMNLLRGRAIEEDIILLSMGDMFELWWARALEAASAKEDFLVVASIGNGTQTLTPKPLYPAAGSNVLGVGVVDAVIDPNGVVKYNMFSTARRSHSSSGPTEDFRCKPDIVAPGTALVPSYTQNNSYILRTNWSSLSAPIVAGTASLLTQRATSDETLKEAFDQPGKSVVLKSILINAAKKLPYWHKGKPGTEDDHETPLDFVQGAGMLDALAAYKQLIAGNQSPGSVAATGWDNRILGVSKQSYDYTFEVTEPNQMLTATLCWNRAYQNEYPFGHLLDKDTDLRLELWGPNPNDPNTQALLDYSDSINDNVEHIYFAAGSGKTPYTIKVLFNEQQKPGAQQRFALSWSVGPDRQAGNPWWNDLNGDDTVDPMDQIIFEIFNNGLFNDSEAVLKDVFKLSSERAELLSTQWPDFQPYVTGWTLSK